MNSKHTSLRRFIVLRILMFSAVSCCMLQQSFAQVFWTEGWSSNCNAGLLAISAPSVNGTWTISSLGTNDFFANEWYVSAVESSMPVGSCRNSCQIDNTQNNESLHLGSVAGSPNSASCPNGGDCGANYDIGGFTPNQVRTNKRIESPAINCTGKSTITLSFKYIEAGDGTNDNAIIWYFNGTTWVVLVDPPKTSLTSCGGNGVWTTYSVSLPTSANNNANVRIGFQWVNNDDAIGTNPAFAVDDITLASAIVPVVADFVVDSTVACSGSQLHFRDTSSGNPIGWGWAFPGGTPAISSAQYPVVTYATPGIYTVRFAVYNANDTDTIIRTNYIKINNCVPPTANFVASKTSICQNNCINFTDLSTDSATSWQWSFLFSNTPVSSLQNPVNICYSAPGSYDVQLIVANAYGRDTLKLTSYIDVTFCPPPGVGFISDINTGCDTVCVNFFDQTSSTTPLHWQWEFPGATPDTSTAQNPTNICYTSDGLFDVKLIATNDGGTDSLIQYSFINVSSVPTATISGDITLAYGESDTLHAGGGITYQWFPAEGLDSTNIPNPVASPAYTTTYYCLISDGTCHTIRQVVVTVTREKRVYIPDAFSPNGDGQNDVLRIRGNHIFSGRLAIFDRWGEKVFDSSDLNTGWDGTYNGEPLNGGVFTYVAFVIFDTIDATDPNDATLSVTQTGTVALIR